MRKQPKDISWPPLDVQDIKPDGNTTKEKISFGIMKQAIEKSKKKS